MGRFASWDEALARREPLRFEFMGTVWQVTGIDFRDVPVVDKAINGAVDDEDCSKKCIDFLAAHVTEGEKFRAAAEAFRPIEVRTLIAGVQWVVQNEIGLPLEIGDDDPDPLARSADSSPSSKTNGRSSAGGSRKSASKTP